MRLPVLALIASCVACQHSGQTPGAPAPTTQPSAAPGKVVPTTEAPSDAAAPPAPLELAPLSPQQARGAFVEIRFPIAEQRIRQKKLDAYRVRLKKQGDGQLWLALDGHRPRKVDSADGSLPLSALVPADVDLAAGAHWLSATLAPEAGAPYATTQESRQPVAALRFWAEERTERAAPAPRVVLFQPGGTYNGSAARVIVHAAAFHLPSAGLAPDGFRVRVMGEGRTGAVSLPAVTPLEIRDLPSGDFTIAVELVDPAGQRIAFAERSIVVNRDAPVGKLE